MEIQQEKMFNNQHFLFVFFSIDDSLTHQIDLTYNSKYQPHSLPIYPPLLHVLGLFMTEFTVWHIYQKDVRYRHTYG